MKKKHLKIAAVVSLVLLAGIQFVRPARTNPAADPAEALSAHVPTAAHVTAILEHSCRDCHSSETRWPWYSNVAPVSWWVIDHVDHGRSHFNYSQWARYTPEEQKKLLKESCELAKKGAMPLGSYLTMHRSARLSPADVTAICVWAQSAALRASH